MQPKRKCSDAGCSDGVRSIFANNYKGYTAIGQYREDMMSKVEVYRYDGSVRPDFQSLPTVAKPAGDLSETEAAEYTEFLKEKASANLAEITSLQRGLREAGKRSLVVILHGMPYSGKSETGRYLKKGMGKGVKLCSYESGRNERDFLWQMHRRMPKYGKVCIMSGSVYSDIPDGEGRAPVVKAFEKYLKESGISVIRVFLHVSAKRQKKRMLEVITTKPGGSAREMPTDKNWRREYLDRFADTIEAAATPGSPWYIIPADSKWYLRCIVTELVRDELRACVSLQAEAGEAEAASAEETAEETVVEAAPAAEVSAADVPVEAAAESVPAEEVPAEVVVEAAPAGEAPEEEKPVEVEAEAAPAEVVVEAAPAGEAPEEEKPVEVEAEAAPAEVVVEAAPAEEAPEEEKPVEVEAEAASAEEVPAEVIVEATPAEEVPAEVVVEAAPAEEKPAEAEPKKPARRTRRKKTVTEAEAAESAPAKKPVRRQGPPKTVEETLAKRRRRNSSANG